MLKIGEFARISQVSIKTLRHYDALGVLRPSQIDPENGYRFYEMGQLTDVVRILALKDCGFALEEIAQLLRTHDAEAIEQLLRHRVVAQQSLVAEEQARLHRMLARLSQLASADSVPLYDVALKQTEALTLVGLRQCVATTQEIGPFAWSVVQRLEQAALIPVGPLIHLYYDLSERDEGDETLDLFVGAAVSALPSTMTTLDCERLVGGEQVACVIYRGDYTGISAAYTALDHWLMESGYQIGGCCREIYHWSPMHTTDASSYLTEIQYPLLNTNNVSQNNSLQEQE